MIFINQVNTSRKKLGITFMTQTLPQSDHFRSGGDLSKTPNSCHVTFSSVPSTMEKALLESRYLLRHCKLRLVILTTYKDDMDLKEMAKNIKTRIDTNTALRGEQDKGSWQCIIGKSFGSALSFERSYCLMTKILPGGKHVRVMK